MCRVALLEDDADLRTGIARYLALQGGHDIAEAGTLKEFWGHLKQLQIAVLDLKLPDGTALDALARIRAECPRAGVIILTGEKELEAKLTLLGQGADHYFCKPVQMVELNAIIGALARRLGFGGWSLDILRRQIVSPCERPLALNETEVTFLQTLAQTPGDIIPRKEVVAALGHNWRVYDMRRLDQLVSRLRRRWWSRHNTALPIHTEHGKGYAFAEGISVI